jgi:hypothetical protein
VPLLLLATARPIEAGIILRGTTIYPVLKKRPSYRGEMILFERLISLRH